MQRKWHSHLYSKGGSKCTALLQLTCLMAVTVMTKNSGNPLVIGLVGVSMINWSERNTEGQKYTWMASTVIPFFAILLTIASNAAFFSLEGLRLQ